MCWSLWLAEYKKKSRCFVHTHLSLRADGPTDLEAHGCIHTHTSFVGNSGCTGVRGAPLWSDWAVWEHKVAFSWFPSCLGGLTVCLCVCGQRRTYTHPAKVRWVNVCGGKGWQDSQGVVPTHTHTPSFILAEQIFCQRRADDGASPLFLTGFLLVLGRAQDGLAMPKQDPEKPQPLLESVRPPPASPSDSGGKH